MKKVLVTGSSGMLGQHIVTQLINKTEYTVRTMSHKAQPAPSHPRIEQVQADLESGQGLAKAVKDIDLIIHAASNNNNAQEIDIVGTKILVQTALAAGVSHIIYVSIVGIDRVPLPYFKYKVAAEEIIKNSGVPWSILRATQFHPFVEVLLQLLTKIPLIALIPTDFKTQPVYEGDVAERLVEMTSAGPVGYAPDMAGPEALMLGTMARSWLKQRGERRLIIPVRLPGKIAQAFRRGNALPRGEYTRGTLSWRDWLPQSSSAQIWSEYGNRYVTKK